MLKQLKSFISETYNDRRIPDRDKKVILGILILIIIRILFIPDWIPYFGILDVLFFIGIISDYFFGVLDQNILLCHYPWGMKSFARFKRVAQFLAFFAPYFVTDHLWVYTKEPF